MEGKDFRASVGGLKSEEVEGEEEPVDVVGDLEQFKNVNKYLT